MTPVQREILRDCRRMLGWQKDLKTEGAALVARIDEVLAQPPQDAAKMEGLGRMIFSHITDVLVASEGVAQAYGRQTVTMPDGRGGKHSLVVIVATHQVADAMEEAAGMRFGVQPMQGDAGGRKQ